MNDLRRIPSRRPLWRVVLVIAGGYVAFLAVAVAVLEYTTRQDDALCQSYEIKYHQISATGEAVDRHGALCEAIVSRCEKPVSERLCRP
jgi:hypothetical protein